MNEANEKIFDAPTLAGFFGGLLIGGAAGAGAMLLLAPQSGKKTRRQIRRKGRDLREQTSDSIEDSVAQTRARAQDVKTNIQGQTEALQQRGQDALDDGKERLATAVDAGKSAVTGS